MLYLAQEKNRINKELKLFTRDFLGEGMTNQFEAEISVHLTVEWGVCGVTTEVKTHFGEVAD